ncbi:MAG TPA: hypothetical protein VGD72_15280 [Mycobacteriales bacterium]|jgi:ABC-2 type transport system permease protein
MTGVLARLVWRRLQLRTALWALGLLVLTSAVVTSYQRLYPAPADRAGLTASAAANASFRALLGVPGDLSTPGGYTAWRVGVFLGVLAGLYGLLTVVAFTRGEEEAGRWELIWAGTLRRHAPLLVTLLGVASGCVVLGGAVSGALLAAGAGGRGAVLVGAWVAVVGLDFAAAGTVTAQLAAARRAASALAGAALGLAYLVRMAADGAHGRAWLAWASPLGWLEKVDAYRADNAGPVLLGGVVAVVLFAVAFVLEGNRDLGAGLWHTGAGPAGTRWIRTPELLAFRVYAGSVLGWAAGVAVLGAVVAAIAVDVGDFVGQDPQTARLIARFGGSGDLARAYLGGSFQFIGVLVVVVAVGGVLRIRAEEIGGRAEAVLAQPVRRTRWAAAYLLAGLGGAVCAAAAAGLAGAGTAAARPGGDPAGVLAAAANALPAALCFAGLACALVGFLPRRATVVGLAVPVVLFLLDYFGRLLEVPGAVLTVSPFHHVATVPAEGFDLPGAVALAVAGVVLAALGLVGVQRRDLVPA